MKSSFGTCGLVLVWVLALALEGTTTAFTFPVIANSCCSRSKRQTKTKFVVPNAKSRSSSGGGGGDENDLSLSQKYKDVLPPLLMEIEGENRQQKFMMNYNSSSSLLLIEGEEDPQKQGKVGEVSLQQSSPATKDLLLLLPKIATIDSDEDNYSEDSSIQLVDQVSQWIILLLGSTALAVGMGELLLRFEWFQDWRYSWPLVGCLYIYDGFNDNQFLLSSLKGKGWSKLTSIVCGVGLLIGGAYDAFMPVWMTGPNLVTNAGIHQDSAVVLIFLTVVAAARFPRKEKEGGTKFQKSKKFESRYNPTRTLLLMTLIAQLYKLGESSMDELVSNAMTIF